MKMLDNFEIGIFLDITDISKTEKKKQDEENIMKRLFLRKNISIHSLIPYFSTKPKQLGHC